MPGVWPAQVLMPTTSGRELAGADCPSATFETPVDPALRFGIRRCVLQRVEVGGADAGLGAAVDRVFLADRPFADGPTLVRSRTT